MIVMMLSCVCTASHQQHCEHAVIPWTQCSHVVSAHLVIVAYFWVTYRECHVYCCRYIATHPPTVLRHLVSNSIDARHEVTLKTKQTTVTEAVMNSTSRIRLLQLRRMCSHNTYYVQQPISSVTEARVNELCHSFSDYHNRNEWTHVPVLR